MIVDINPVQEGSGDPSPSNVRPISGWNSINVYISPTTSPEDGRTIPIDLQQTVFGGVLDVVNGKLTITHYSRIFDGTETYFYQSSTRWGWLDTDTSIPYAKTQERAGGMCSHFLYEMY